MVANEEFFEQLQGSTKPISEQAALGGRYTAIVNAAGSASKAKIATEIFVASLSDDTFSVASGTEVGPEENVKKLAGRLVVNEDLELDTEKSRNLAQQLLTLGS